MATTSNSNNIESNNAVYNAIIAAIKGDRMIGRHIAQTYGTNGPRPVYGIEVWESIVYVHTDTDRRIFGKAIDRLLKAHEDLFKWADFQKESEEGPYIVLALTDETVKAKKEAEDVKETDFSDTLADDLKEGDRVLSRHYGAQATVLGREWDNQRKAWYYRVKFDTMQRNMDGSEFNVTEFHRDGLTKNYDPVTCSERVGNAEYFRETLLAEFWGNNRTPRTVYGMEIFKPTDRRPSWLVVADIFSEPKEMTLCEVCDMLAVRYQEEHGKAA